jgi:ABC-type multidrug transport system ATPase subunit
VYPRVDAVMLLDHFAQLKGISNGKERKNVVEALLQRTNLWEHRHKNLGTFSGGMKQRFGIAQALLGNPSLIIVDEPTAGLDPTERNRFHNLLSEISERVVVILSTHIIEDVQSLCHHMAIINKGEILAYGKPQELMTKFQGKIWKKQIAKNELSHFEQFPIVSQHLVGGKIEIVVCSETPPTPDFEAGNISLEDVYFAVINKN